MIGKRLRLVRSRKFERNEHPAVFVAARETRNLEAALIEPDPHCAHLA